MEETAENTRGSAVLDTSLFVCLFVFSIWVFFHEHS